MILQPMKLRWIQGAADDPEDICAHGDVEFRIGDDSLINPIHGRDLTTSAAALYLLRTLATPHTKDAPVGDHMFPCCGFSMYDIPDQDDVAICGCPSGEDLEVLHTIDGNGVVIRTTDGREWLVSWPEWRTAVFEFADKVSDFYAACSPKQPHDEEDAKGFSKFKAEWERRRGKKFGVTN